MLDLVAEFAHIFHGLGFLSPEVESQVLIVLLSFIVGFSVLEVLFPLSLELIILCLLEPELVNETLLVVSFDLQDGVRPPPGGINLLHHFLLFDLQHHDSVLKLRVVHFDLLAVKLALEEHGRFKLKRLRNNYTKRKTGGEVRILRRSSNRYAVDDGHCLRMN